MELLPSCPNRKASKARDGAPLNYRVYSGRTDRPPRACQKRAVVLVHGSSAHNASMLKLAQRLQAAGATVTQSACVAMGAGGTANGDISYVGQLDDDLVDLVKGLALDRPGVRRTWRILVGGGSCCAIAGSPACRPVSTTIWHLALHCPGLAHLQTRLGGWASVAAGPRIIALSLPE